jgi:FAD/FMN-containing dehydrogenase
MRAVRASTSIAAMTSIETLPALTGDVVTPDQAAWDLARRAWNLAVDQRPACVAFPADAADVQTVLEHAIRTGLKVAPQGTGHNAAALGSLEGTILLSTQRMRGVEIDVEARTARVQAGTLWIEVSEAATPHGLFPLSGSSPDVGVVGYTLGGGLSWLARRHGLAANAVTAIELVTPDAQLVRATPDVHPDLFWALRGGGGNFGVVTAMEFELFPYGEVYGGMLLWPYDRHAEVLHAWHALTETAPEELTTAIRIMHFPPLPELPPFLSGRSVVVIDGAYAGGAEEGAAAIAALRALEPEMDTFAPSSPAVLSRIHMDPEEPIPYLGLGATLGTLDAAALDAFAADIQPGSPVLFGELRHVGGAAGRVPAGGGAAGCIRGEYMLFSVGLALSPEMAAGAAVGQAALNAAMAPWATGKEYLNFVEHAVDTATLYDGEDYARLRAIRAAVDPAGRMVGNHPIPAAV